MAYSPEEYRTALKQAIRYVARYRYDLHRLWNYVFDAAKSIATANRSLATAERARDLDRAIGSINEAYETLNISEADFNEFMFYRVYHDLLIDISTNFKELDYRHIAAVLGIGAEDFESLWFEGFVNANALAQDYYHTMKTVAESLKEISDRLKEIRESYGHDEDTLSEEHKEELKHIGSALSELSGILRDMPRYYAERLANAISEDAISILQFLVEEIERAIASRT